MIPASTPSTSNLPAHSLWRAQFSLIQISYFEEIALFDLLLHQRDQEVEKELLEGSDQVKAMQRCAQRLESLFFFFQ
jgi:ribonuclease D